MLEMPWRSEVQTVFGVGPSKHEESKHEACSTPKNQGIFA